MSLIHNVLISPVFSLMLPEQKAGYLLFKTAKMIPFFERESDLTTGNIHSVCLMLGQQSSVCLRLNTTVTCCSRPLIYVKVHRTNLWKFWDINISRTKHYLQISVGRLREHISLRLFFFILGCAGKYVLGTTAVTLEMPYK